MKRYLYRRFSLVLLLAVTFTVILASANLYAAWNATLVSIRVTPANPSIPLGATQQFTATGTYSDGSQKTITNAVTWSSDVTSVATITKGIAMGRGIGGTTIRAASGSISGSATLSVTPAVLRSIAVAPPRPTITVGDMQQFSATATYTDGSRKDLSSSVIWSSGTPSVATIDNRGLATALAIGSTTISAVSGSIKGSTTLYVKAVSLVSITVTPASPSVPLGNHQQFTATGRYSNESLQDITGSVTWASTSTSVSTIVATGLSTAVGLGGTTITATSGSVVGSTTLTVTAAVLKSILVTPANSTLALGLHQQFTATGTLSDGTTQDFTSSATWTSSVVTVATISSGGLASAVGIGDTTVSATLGGITGSTGLSVTSATLVSIAVAPANSSIALGRTQQFTAIGTYTDGTTQNLTGSATWTSSAPGIATISNASGSQGWASSAAVGNTTIGAAMGSVTGSTSLTVSPAELVSIAVTPATPSIALGRTQQFIATGTYAGGLTNDVSGSALWSSASPAVATINATGLATSQASGQTVITASIGPVSDSTTLTVTAVPIPTNFRADISVGTTGQLFVSWDTVTGATYYNLQRSTNSDSGYTPVAACSGLANVANTSTTGGMRACRDGDLTPGNVYYYQVQACNSTGCSDFSAAASNVPVTSDCTAAQMPDLSGVKTLSKIKIPSSLVDPAIQFLPTNVQSAAYAVPTVPRRNLLLVVLPGSGEVCPGPDPFIDTAQKLGFDELCVNYSNLSSQQEICLGDPDCFGNISQAKLDATGPCSMPGQAHCGIDPKTGQPFYLSNPADAITQRISMMLQYLNAHGYNKNGTTWGNYLSGTTPLWQNILLGGHSQGGAMSTFTAYKQVIARAINLSGPPQATRVNGVEVGASYFTSPKATDIRSIYGLVSVADLYYQQGAYSAVWQLLGFTEANNDAEVMLNTSTPIGLNCNTGIPSHNFSTSAPSGPAGGHNTTLYLWNEDVYKFMLID